MIEDRDDVEGFSRDQSEKQVEGSRGAFGWRQLGSEMEMVQSHRVEEHVLVRPAKKPAAGKPVGGFSHFQT